MAIAHIDIRSSRPQYNSDRLVLDRYYAVSKHLNYREFALVVNSHQVSRPENHAWLDRLAERVMDDMGLTCRYDIPSHVLQLVRKGSNIRQVSVMLAANRLKQRGIVKQLRKYVDHYMLDYRQTIDLLEECVLLFGEELNNPALFALMPEPGQYSTPLWLAIRHICADAGIELFIGDSYHGLPTYLETYVRRI